MFIVIEGIDGTGKSSVSKALKEYLSNKYKNKNIISLTSPSQEETGILVRKALNKKDISETELMDLFFEDFKYINNEILTPYSNDNNTIIICDRYIYSFMAYQGEILGIETVEKKFNDEETLFTAPDMILLLDSCPEITYKRLSDKDHIENKGIKFQKKVRKAYLHTLKNWINDGLAKVIDSSKPIDFVIQECIKHINLLDI